jgi:15-cis-phytoene desaturase
MDSMTISEYAAKLGINCKLVTRIITPLSAGLFFLPPDRYSAFVFFGLFLPFLHRSLKTRVGAFRGGMTEVMANPLRDYIIRNGDQVHTSSPVESLMVNLGKVEGVFVNGRPRRARHVVLATSLYPAQQLLKQAFAHHDWFGPLLQMQTMP